MSEHIISELGQEIIKEFAEKPVNGTLEGTKDTWVEIDESNWLFHAMMVGARTNEVPVEWKDNPRFWEAKLYFMPQSDGGQVWLFREKSKQKDGTVTVDDQYVQLTSEGALIGEISTIESIKAGVRKLRELDAAQTIGDFLTWELRNIRNDKNYRRGAAMEGRVIDGKLHSPWPAPEAELIQPAQGPVQLAEADQ